MKKIAMILLFAVSVTVSACQFGNDAGYSVVGVAFPIITHVNDIPVTSMYEARHEILEEYKKVWCSTPMFSTVSTNTPFRITVAWKAWPEWYLDTMKGSIGVGLVWVRRVHQNDPDPELLEKTIVLRMYLSEDDGATWQLLAQRRFSSIDLLLNEHSRLLGGKIFPSGLGGTYPPGKQVKIRLQAAYTGYESNPLSDNIDFETEQLHQTPWNSSIDHVVTVTITGERRPGEAY